MLDSFYSLGISHWNCPLETREQFSMNKEQKNQFLTDIQSIEGASAFLVSTCNRTQVYANNINTHLLKELFLKHTGNHKEDFEKYGFVYQSEIAIQNLFEVSTGIDSQILGDLQIFSQVKEGVEFSKKHNVLDAQMDRLLQFVFQANKEVQSNTTISKGAASVAHAALLKIRQNTQNLFSKKILLFGTGEIGQRTLENLNSQTKAEIVIVNRTDEKAIRLAEEHNVRSVSIEKLEEEILSSDVLVVATASKNYTISEEHIKNINSKKLFIDLSVPRNIDPKVSDNNYIELFDMDQLNSEADKTLNDRKKDIPKAKTIINLHKLEFEDWVKLHNLGPVIKSLGTTFENIKDTEINKYKGQYQSDDIQKVKPLIDSIVKKISSQNIEYLRKRYRYNEDILEIIKEMYKLN
jgi:glutamyl-tRNA reductase